MSGIPLSQALTSQGSAPFRGHRVLTCFPCWCNGFSSLTPAKFLEKDSSPKAGAWPGHMAKLIGTLETLLQISPFV